MSTFGKLNFFAGFWQFSPFTFRPFFNFTPLNLYSSNGLPLFSSKETLNVDTYQPSNAVTAEAEKSTTEKANETATPAPGLIYNNIQSVITVPFAVNVPKSNEDKAKEIASKQTVSVKSSSATTSETSDSEQKNDGFNLSDYSIEAGVKLAKTALKRAVGWTGYCARYVKNAIARSGLGAYVSGHAYQMLNILRNNKNFKEISAKEVNVSKLPAGCVLVYDKGASGYSRKYGHVEITTGDGRGVSDGITRSLENKKPTAIFVPVKQGNLA